MKKIILILVSFIYLIIGKEQTKSGLFIYRAVSIFNPNDSVTILTTVDYNAKDTIKKR